MSPNMFEQHISADILINHDEKLISRNHLYLCQPHTVIQLIEVASPPPRRISSVINSSSAASSSYTSSSSSSFEENQGEEEEEEEEVEESIHSSYCSSDDDIDVRMSPRAASHPESLSGRMKRILLWREQSPQLLSDSTSLKRRLDEIAEDALDNDDNVSHTSKRSRSSDSSSSVSSDRSTLSLELMHSCPACDAFFPTRQSLRQHGQDAKSNEACSVAVEYAFE